MAGPWLLPPDALCDPRNICPVCQQNKPAADDYGHCSYHCASGGGEWRMVEPVVCQTAFGAVTVTSVSQAEGGGFVLRGPGTFGCRETIKSASLAAGAAAKWNAADKSWQVPRGTRLPAALPQPPPAAAAPAPPAPKKKWEMTRDEYQNWLARSRKKYFGPCCSRAQAYESRPYGPICYDCEIHGKTINDYTGD